MDRTDWERVQRQLARMVKDAIDRALARRQVRVLHGTMSGASSVRVDGEASSRPATALNGTYSDGQRVAVLGQGTKLYILGRL